MWILVADAWTARLFEAEESNPHWRLIQQFTHPESRAKGDALMTDRPGRMGETGLSPKDFEARRFARSLSEYLEKGVSQQGVERLVLVGPPTFLGLLRKYLSHSVLARLSDTLDKDYTRLRSSELTQRLQRELLI